MAYVFTLCRGIIPFLVWALGDRPGKAVQRLVGDPTEVVQCQCSCLAISAKSKIVRHIMQALYMMPTTFYRQRAYDFFKFVIHPH